MPTAAAAESSLSSLEPRGVLAACAAPDSSNQGVPDCPTECIPSHSDTAHPAPPACNPHPPHPGDAPRPLRLQPQRGADHERATANSNNSTAAPSPSTAEAPQHIYTTKRLYAGKGEASGQGGNERAEGKRQDARGEAGPQRSRPQALAGGQAATPPRVLLIAVSASHEPACSKQVDPPRPALARRH